MYTTNRQQFSMVCTPIDHTDNVNMFQTQVEPRAAGEWFYGKVLNILISFLLSIRLKDKCSLINFTKIHKKGSACNSYK